MKDKFVLGKITSKDLIIICFSILIICFSILTIVANIKEKNEKQLKYAVVIDCGSSGSRIHLFQYKHSDGSLYLPQVEKVKRDGQSIVRKTDIALSSFETKPHDVISYLNTLINKMYEFIPPSEVKETELYIFCTAGMRSIPKNNADAIVDFIKKDLPQQMRFKLKSVEIITGQKEGLSMWVALNYMLDKFHKICGDTINIIEMGGSSTQVAFETTINNQNTIKFEYICKNTGVKTVHNVYSTTFPGLGINEALKYYRTEQFKTSAYQVTDSCLANGCIETVGSKTYSGTGLVEDCYTNINTIFSSYFGKSDIKNNYDEMKIRFNTENTPKHKDVYALASFHYAFRDFIHYSGPLVKDLYWPRITEFCITECRTHMDYLRKKLYNTNEVKYLHAQCFRVSFMRLIIEKLFETQKEKPLINYNEHRGESIDYTIGALLFALSQK